MAKTTTKAKTKAADKTEKKLPQPKVKKRQQVPKGTHGGTQIVLIEDVQHLGKQGDLVEVKAGYARNYLLPNSLAVIPTAHNLKLLERYKIKVQKARDAKVADLKVLAEQISRLTSLTIEANATEDGHLYGSIGPIEISKTLKGKNLMVEHEMVKLEHHIKEANTLTEVPLSLGYGIEAKIQVLVVALQQTPPKK
ncbi:50S ribosomal protein L9 [Fimbriiglobus ruber]|uniref:Large ribosomal subunit protein bL9 n=1 Tax=Fimbriiglobus ruber TaxID=1908690 RepID=A0A225DH48_9BACT|nr:50S ribosomal protein L9 [Fimbriiglobus ruber]OWK40762.1 LSU ribosomal protein L9p [Fimbriiglobus ruber]